MICTKKLYALAAAAAVLFTAGTASAQTAPVTASATVQNTLTLAVTSNLNWGTVVAVGDTGTTAELILNPDGTLDTTNANPAGAAVIASVDSSTVTAGHIDVSDGADGAAINVDIQNVVDPTDGTDSFTLSNFMTSWNGAVAVARTAGTPWTVTFDSAFGGGVNTMDIGASIITIDPSTTYGDGAYAGGFDVVFSY